MRSCKDIAKLASESMDHPLPWYQKLSLWIHARLCSCPLCRKFYGQMMATREAARELDKRLESGDAGGDAILSPEARERIRGNLSAPTDDA